MAILRLRGLALALAALAALAPRAPAFAQDNPLLGDWLSSSRSADPADERGFAYALTFRPDGRGVLSLVVANGATTESFSYRLTGPNAYEAVMLDYAPHMLCTMVCTPMRPLIPLGARLHCGFRAEGANVLDIECDHGGVLRA